MKNPYDAPWSKRQIEKMYGALVECARIVALLDDDGPADGRRARELHEELRRVLAGVGLVTARPPRPKATPPAAPLVRDRARQARIQRGWYPTTAKKSKT